MVDHQRGTAIDTTLVSSLSRNGTARPRCATVSGAAMEYARIQKERRYLELVGGSACRSGGRDRFCSETTNALASAKVRESPLISKQDALGSTLVRDSSLLHLIFWTRLHRGQMPPCGVARRCVCAHLPSLTKKMKLEKEGNRETS